MVGGVKLDGIGEFQVILETLTSVVLFDLLFFYIIEDVHQFIVQCLKTSKIFLKCHVYSDNLAKKNFSNLLLLCCTETFKHLELRRLE